MAKRFHDFYGNRMAAWLKSLYGGSQPAPSTRPKEITPLHIQAQLQARAEDKRQLRRERNLRVAQRGGAR